MNSNIIDQFIMPHLRKQLVSLVSAPSKTDSHRILIHTDVRISPAGAGRYRGDADHGFFEGMDIGESDLFARVQIPCGSCGKVILDDARSQKVEEGFRVGEWDTGVIIAAAERESGA